MVDEPPRRATSIAWSVVMAGPWATRFMRQETGPREWKTWSVPVFGLRIITDVVRNSGGELQQDVLHRLGALLPGRQLGVDAQAVGAGEARGAALLADELDH